MNRIVLFLLLAGLVYAQAPYLLVMDSTGSMSDDLPNSTLTKMEAARAAATDFVDSASGDIGMMIFADCDSGGDYTKGSIRVVENFTTDKAALREKIAALKPQSNTAIADALTEAGDYLADTKGKGTIIIITDGEETCGGDPVSLAGQIYQNGTAKIHVVGFLLGDTAEQKAMQIAQAGGGRYYGANDTSELTQALQQIESEGALPPCCPAIILPGLLVLTGLYLRK